jgi:hypothetical protein
LETCPRQAYGVPCVSVVQALEAAARLSPEAIRCRWADTVCPAGPDTVTVTARVAGCPPPPAAAVQLGAEGQVRSVPIVAAPVSGCGATVDAATT